MALDFWPVFTSCRVLLESNVHISRTWSLLITINHLIWQHPMRIWWHQTTPPRQQEALVYEWLMSLCSKGSGFGLRMSIGNSSNYGQAALNRWWYAGCPCFDSLAGWTLHMQGQIQMSSCAYKRILALARSLCSLGMSVAFYALWFESLQVCTMMDTAPINHMAWDNHIWHTSVTHDMT